MAIEVIRIHGGYEIQENGKKNKCKGFEARIYSTYLRSKKRSLGSRDLVKGGKE